MIKINFAGEVEIVKGGPGSGPRQGDSRGGDKGTMAFKPGDRVQSNRDGKSKGTVVEPNSHDVANGTHSIRWDTGGTWHASPEVISLAGGAKSVGEKGDSEYPERESDTRRSVAGAAWDKAKATLKRIALLQ